MGSVGKEKMGLEKEKWVISQQNDESERYPVRFGGKVCSGQRKYVEIKREAKGGLFRVQLEL